MSFIFSAAVLIRHLWQLKTVVFLHWCLIRATLLYVDKSEFVKTFFSYFCVLEKYFFSVKVGLPNSRLLTTSKNMFASNLKLVKVALRRLKMHLQVYKNL
jgi:hypothetical protein